MNEQEPVIRSINRFGGIALVVGVVMLLASVIGGIIVGWYPFFQGYHYAWIFWLNVTLGCLGGMLLQNTVRALWGYGLQRMFEAGSRMTVLMAVLGIPVLLFGMQIYPWMHPEAAHDPILVHRALYMNMPFFVGRYILWFAIWIFLAFRLSAWSVEQDAADDPRVAWHIATKRMNWSAPGLVIFVLSMTWAYTDWVMSLYPHWFSTIFGLLFLVGQGLGAFSLGTLVLMQFAHREPFDRFVGGKVTRDIGNMLLTMVILWGYIALSQILLVWSANLPQETAFYLARMNRPTWWWLGTCLAFGQFFVPFLLLLSNRTKLVPKLLAATVAYLFFIRVMDVYWLVIPSWRQVGPTFRWMDFTSVIGIGGIWLSLVARNYVRHPFLPRHAPRLEQAIAMHGTPEMES